MLLHKKHVDFDLMNLKNDGGIEEKDFEGFGKKLIDRVIELSKVDW